MKSVSVLLLISILGSALAAPAIVWKNGQAEPTVRTSKEVSVTDLFSDVLSVEPESSSLASVVFLIGRGEDGSESLSTMASAGLLPNVEAKYNNANAIHHYVTGVETHDTIVRDANHVCSGSKSAMVVSLDELNNKLASHSETLELEVSQDGVMSKAQKYSHKRTQDMSKAGVLIVKVDPRVDSAALDSAVVGAIEHDAVSSVVLTAIRSHDEVKHERMMNNNRRLSKMTKTTVTHGRRLEDQEQQDGGENQQQEQNNDDMTGVYYVSMTPNILAGILFTLMFFLVTYIGVTCMGMIAGQDVYVKKLPPVGREA